jgi:hypothetical protein
MYKSDILNISLCMRTIGRYLDVTTLVLNPGEMLSSSLPLITVAK